MLQYTNPVWAALLAAWLLAEPLARREVALVGLSLAGVVMIARPSFPGQDGAGGLDPVAVGAGLLGAALSGAAYVGVRELARTEHPLVIVFYFPLVTVPASLPGALSQLVLPTAREWLLLVGIGVAAQCGQVYLTRGLQQEPAGRATAIGFLQVVFAAVWGFLFFAESPDGWSLGGASLILLCTLGMAIDRGRPAAAAVDAGGPPRGIRNASIREGGP